RARGGVRARRPRARDARRVRRAARRDREAGALRDRGGVMTTATEASAAALPATVEVPTEALLDAIAALHALYEYHSHLAGMLNGDDRKADSKVSDWCVTQATALRHAAFGEFPDP